MEKKEPWGYPLAGLCAGAVNGLFGAGGGMVLLPLLGRLTPTQEESLFPTSVAIILPVCLTSLLCSLPGSAIPWGDGWPYLLGSAAGGVLAGRLGGRIPTLWLHRILGLLLLWGGVQNLC